MATSSEIEGAGMPAGRTIEIEVMGPTTSPAAGAEISFRINGAPAGRVTVGSIGNKPVFLELSDAHATVELGVSLLGQFQHSILPPGQDFIRFVFQSVPHFAVGVRGTAECPDGRKGSPCVTCKSGNATWRMCG